MGKSTPAPPAAPDPVATANAQSASNRETAIANAQLNFVNQRGPLGSRTYNQIGTWADGTPRFEQTDTLSADQQTALNNQFQVNNALSGLALTGAQRAGQVLGQQFTLPNSPALQTSINTSGLPALPGAVQAGQISQLSGMQDSLAGAGQGIQNRIADAGNVQSTLGNAGEFSGQIANAGPIGSQIASAGDVTRQIAGAGAVGTQIADAGQIGNRIADAGQIGNRIADAGNLQRSVAGAGQGLQSYVRPSANLQTQIAEAGAIRTGIGGAGEGVRNDIGFQAQQGLGRAGIQSQLDVSGVPALQARVGANDFSADRFRVEDALFSRLNPQLARDQAALENRLANQGIVRGSEAWTAEMNAMSQRINDARTSAVLNAGQEQSRLFGMDLSAGQFANQARGQSFSEQQALGSFANAAQQQDFAQRATERGMFTSEAAQAAAFANAAQQQAFGQRAADAAFANAAQQQQFGQNAQQAQFGNDTRNLGFQQSLQSAALQNAAQAQGFGQNVAAGQFTNEAQQAAFAQNQAQLAAQNAAQAQGFGQNAQQLAAQNAAQAQQFGQNAQQLAAQNAGQAQLFGQNAQQAAFANTAQGQVFGQNQAALAAANAAQAQQFGQNQAQQATDQSAQAQRFAQLLAGGQFGNAAQQQVFGQNQAQQAAINAAQAQAFQQGGAAAAFRNQTLQDQAAFNNSAQAQQFQQGLTNAQLLQSLRGQGFNEASAQATFGNQARQQAINEALLQRSQPINEIAALLGTGQVQMPQFQGYTPTQIAPTDVIGAQALATNAQMGAYQAQMANSAARTQGLFGLAGNAATLAVLCFAGESPVEMADGSVKPIQDVRVGDETRGGRVYSRIEGDGTGEDWYSYDGVRVTGSHAVFEGGAWIRVHQSAIAVPIDPVPVLYSLGATRHEIWIDGIRFADSDEVDRDGPIYQDAWRRSLASLEG